MQRCNGTNVKGEPCKSPFVDPDTGFCAAHGPNAKARMSARGARGAEATRRKLKGRGTVKGDKAPDAPETMADAKMIAAWAVRATVTGELDPRVAQQTAALLREFRSASKESDLAAELEELRQQVADMKKQRGSK